MPTYRERYKATSIKLDCAPGNPRPGDLIAGVLEGTRLAVSDFEPPNKSFHQWTYVLKEGEARAKLFTAHKLTTFKPRIEALYYEGVIQYGSW